MMTVTIATSEHVPAIVLLNDQVQKLHAEVHPQVFKYPVDHSVLQDQFEEMIASPEHVVVVAVVDEQVVGYVWAQSIKRAETAIAFASEKWHIHHVSVADSFQQQGVGRQLLDRLLTLASDAAISQISLDVWQFNEAATRFFQDVGFSSYNSKMWLKL